MVGDPDYKAKFAQAKTVCSEFFEEVSNPCDWDDGLGKKPWIWYICSDIYKLWFGNYDAIVMISDWRNSHGAQIEKLVAERRGVEVIYLENLLNMTFLSCRIWRESEVDFDIDLDDIVYA